jgi:hypothetical protein
MIKRKGVLARPGEYTKNGETYRKTEEELRDAAQRFPIIPLTYGHIEDGKIPTPEQQIGTVKQTWKQYDGANHIEGEFWFFEEKIPEALRTKFDNGEPIPISAGYDASIEDGILKGISYTHVAVLGDDKEPVCPTSGGHLVRSLLEQLDDLEAPEPKAEKEEEAPLEEQETPVKITKIQTVGETPLGVDGVIDEEILEPEEPKTEEPVVQKPKEPVEEEPEEEIRLEPETVIPIDAEAL